MGGWGSGGPSVSFLPVAWEGVGLRCQRESSLANEDQDWSWAEVAGREMKEGAAMNSEELEGSMVEQRD